MRATPDANADLHADTEALQDAVPEQDADYDTDGDGYVYVGANFYADIRSDSYRGAIVDPNYPPHGPAAYSDTGEYDDADIGPNSLNLDASTVHTVAIANFVITYTNDDVIGPIATAKHHHGNQTCNTIAESCDSGGIEFSCVQCGEYTVWNPPD